MHRTELQRQIRGVLERRFDDVVTKLSTADVTDPKPIFNRAVALFGDIQHLQSRAAARRIESLDTAAIGKGIDPRA